jgi:hypothetical protein
VDLLASMTAIIIECMINIMAHVPGVQGSPQDVCKGMRWLKHDYEGSRFFKNANIKRLLYGR